MPGETRADSREHVRVPMRAQLVCSGTAPDGQPFRVPVETFDFSRRGVGLLFKEDLVRPGEVVTVDRPGKFRSNALILWVQWDNRERRYRAGAKLLDPSVNFAARFVLFTFLVLGVFGQFAGVLAGNCVTA